MDDDKKVLECVLGALCHDRDSLFVDRTIDLRGVLLTIKISSRDMPLVIGRGGGMIQAIRTIIRAVGMKNNAAVSIKVIEPITTITPDHGL